MILKKINAILSLLSVAALLLHVGYNSYSYLTLYYNVSLSRWTAVPFMVFVCLHAVLGMIIVFTQSDGTRMDIYKKHNKSTLIQRISAALIFPLLIIHMQTFDLLMEFSLTGNWFMFGLMLFLQAVFYAVVFLHVATSFTKAFITLGLLSDMNKKKKIDRVVYILCAVICVFAIIAVVKGQFGMFL